MKFFEDPPSGSADMECQLLEAAKSGDLEAIQRLLTSYPQIVNCRDLDGRHSTPLHFAAGYNRVSIVEYLLDHGADVHAKDKGWVLKTHCAEKKFTGTNINTKDFLSADWFLCIMLVHTAITKLLSYW